MKEIDLRRKIKFWKKVKNGLHPVPIHDLARIMCNYNINKYSYKIANRIMLKKKRGHKL